MKKSDLIKNSKLVTAPTVIPIATNYLSAEGLQTFIDSHDLDEVSRDPMTPLARLVNGVNYTDMDTGKEGDLLTEFAGRQCYRSWRKGRKPAEYIRNILESGHGSVLEHSVISFVISGVSRSLTHELVRHRTGVAISQESQRYVDADDIRFVVPPLLLKFWGGIDCTEAEEWLKDKENCLEAYRKWGTYLEESLGGPEELTHDMRKRINEAARAELPNAAETRLVWTANYRTLRHVIALRGSEGADLEIRRFAGELLRICSDIAPNTFADMDFAEETGRDLSVPRTEAVFARV
jgi:thymidylate synthase (FAD)